MTEIKKICFFNHYHNGDIVNNRAFVEEIIQHIDVEYYYAHPNNPAIIKDLNIQNASSDILSSLSITTKLSQIEDTLYINTWIGSSFGPENEYTGNCSLVSIYNMFSHIYEELNKIFGTNLKLSNPENYFPLIDYTKYNIFKVSDFVSQHQNQKILFCNGPCLSGQCEYSGDMKSIIIELAEKNPNKIFIATHKFESNISNIKFTDDIIQSDSTDLNEIAYLSLSCDLIVGRASGPLCFCCNSENMNDPTKTFYVFGINETDCPPWNLNVNCNFIFEEYSNYEDLKSSIFDLILES
jgi:hypothetical protein